MESNGWEGTTSPKTYFYWDLWLSDVCFTTSILRGSFSVNNGTYSMCNEVGKGLKLYLHGVTINLDFTADIFKKKVNA
jgi:hypothetical protein